MPSYIDTAPNTGRLIILYEFSQGNQFTRFASSIDYIYNNHVYTGASIKTPRMQESRKDSVTEINLDFPRDNVFAQQFVGYTPDEVTLVTILRGDFEFKDFEYAWRGRVIGGVADAQKISLTCQKIFSSLAVVGLKTRLERSCQYNLFDLRCGVPREQYRDSAVVSSDEGRTLIVPTAANRESGYFSGGEIYAKNGTAKRYISSHVGSTLTLAQPFNASITGGAVDLYPGCALDPESCKQFENYDNYGGRPFMPGSNNNPFSGSAI